MFKATLFRLLFGHFLLLEILYDMCYFADIIFIHVVPINICTLINLSTKSIHNSGKFRSLHTCYT